MLDINSLQDTKVQYLSLDPGVKNFAYSILELIPVIVKGNSTVKVRVIKTGILEFPIQSTSGIQTSVVMFLTELAFMINTHKCSGIIIEQFQSRGFGTKLLELVNIMLGAIVAHFQHIDVVIFSASAWKRAAKDKFDLDKEYKIITCTPHELDATYIGVYGLFRLLEIKPFNGYSSAYMLSIARQVEKVSTTEVRKRLTKR